jgi:hypothetical protein
LRNVWLFAYPFGVSGASRASIFLKKEKEFNFVYSCISLKYEPASTTKTNATMMFTASCPNMWVLGSTIISTALASKSAAKTSTINPTTNLSIFIENYFQPFWLIILAFTVFCHI